NMVHVPYRGVAPAMTDLIGGEGEGVFVVAVGTIEPVKAGKLRALGGTTAPRPGGPPPSPTRGGVGSGPPGRAWVWVRPRPETPAVIADRLILQFITRSGARTITAPLPRGGGCQSPPTPADLGKISGAAAATWAPLDRRPRTEPS